MESAWWKKEAGIVRTNQNNDPQIYSPKSLSPLLLAMCMNYIITRTQKPLKNSIVRGKGKIYANKQERCELLHSLFIVFVLFTSCHLSPSCCWNATLIENPSFSCISNFRRCIQRSQMNHSNVQNETQIT